MPLLFSSQIQILFTFCVKNYLMQRSDMQYWFLCSNKHIVLLWNSGHKDYQLVLPIMRCNIIKQICNNITWHFWMETNDMTVFQSDAQTALNLCQYFTVVSKHFYTPQRAQFNFWEKYFHIFHSNPNPRLALYFLPTIYFLKIQHLIETYAFQLGWQWLHWPSWIGIYVKVFGWTNEGGRNSTNHWWSWPRQGWCDWLQRILPNDDHDPSWWLISYRHKWM